MHPFHHYTAYNFIKTRMPDAFRIVTFKFIILILFHWLTGLIPFFSETGRVLTTMKAGDFFGEIGILNLDGLNK
jgi:succinate dehydrogenase/fumarate reductase cytochrome b subunit